MKSVRCPRSPVLVIVVIAEKQGSCDIPQHIHSNLGCPCTLCFIDREDDQLTHSTAPHVWSQLHAIRAGTGVFWGMVCDLWSLQTQVFTATVGKTAHVTGIRG